LKRVIWTKNEVERLVTNFYSRLKREKAFVYVLRADRHGRPRSIHVVIHVYGGRGSEQGAKRGRGGAVRGQGLAASAIDKLSELNLTGFSAVLPGPDDGKDK